MSASESEPEEERGGEGTSQQEANSQMKPPNREAKPDTDKQSQDETEGVLDEGGSMHTGNYQRRHRGDKGADRWDGPLG